MSQSVRQEATYREQYKISGIQRFYVAPGSGSNIIPAGILDGELNEGLLTFKNNCDTIIVQTKERNA